MKIRIEGSVSLDGEYEADLGYFTNRELHEIKKATGLRAGEFEEAMNSGDNDLLVVMAALMLERAGQKDVLEQLWDLPAGKISFDVSDEEIPEEDDALPPASGPDDEPEPSAEPASSGESSSNGGDPPESDPNLTGFLAFHTGATSAQET